MKKYIFTFLVALSVLISCKNEEIKTVEKVPTENLAFNQMLEDYYERSLELNPINATFTGDDRFNNLFPNFLSEEYKKQKIAYYNLYKEKLKTFKKEDLSETERMSKAVLAWDCDINLEALQFKTDMFPIDQMWTLNLRVGQLASGAGAQPFKTVKDYNNWLERLRGYSIWMKTAKSKMEEGVKTGYVLPKSLIIKIIPQFKELATTDLKSHLFYSPINQLPKSFSDKDKKTITLAYNRMLNENIIPLYKELYHFLSTDYLAAGRSTSGVFDIPNGEKYYEFSIKKYTTTNLTADEIHILGLSEVARILAEMEKVKAEVKYDGDIISFFDAVRNNKLLMPYNKPEQIIDNFNAIHQKMKPQLAKLFDNTPKTLFKVKQTEAFREASASAEYNQGSIDGTRPGVFYVPIPDATKYNVFSDEALFLHEAIPGHHYQISLTQENKNLPKFRKTLWYSAYGEGWALYTESLGKELGLYTDPYQYFGMLSMEMHRAIRLVVDTGIHAKGWSREKAIQYSLGNEAESEASIIAEIERYMANPGQALSYKIGQLKIRELRNKAAITLGDKLDIREFHNQILETGCVPLAILEKKIDAWIVVSK